MGENGQPEAGSPRGRDLALLGAADAPALAIVAARHLGLDPWYDEVRTLRSHVLAPLGTALTDYAEPNNHVLFSALGNLWARLLGVGDLAGALDRPVALRLLPFLLAAPAPLLLFLLARRLHGPGTGVLAALLLATALPFANAACQVRGYGLGITLAAAVLWQAALFRDTGRVRHAAGAAAAGAAAVWTIPLHLYSLAALGAVHGGLFLAGLLRGRPEEARRRDLLLALAAAAGAGIGLALHLPATGSVLGNHWTEPKGGPGLGPLALLLPGLLAAFLAGRWPLVLLLAGGPARAALRPREGDRPLLGTLGWAAALALLPFGISALRGDRPFDRAFLQVLPALSLAAGAAAALLAGPLLRRRWIVPAFAVACTAGLWLSLDARDRRIEADVEAGVRSQGIDRAYFLAAWAPRRVVALLREDPEAAGATVVLGWHDAEALPAVLAAAGVRALPPGDLDRVLDREGRAAVLTSFPRRFEEELRARRPGVAVRRRNPWPSHDNLLLVEVRR
jgi:hypothetical protein